MKIMLDLDNTLVYISNKWLNRCPDFTFRLCGEIYHMYSRPGLQDFVQFLETKNYDIGIWTAGTRDYACSILPRIFGLRWRKKVTVFYHRKRCSIWNGSYIKDLRKIKDYCLLIDDNQEHIRYKIAHYKNDRHFLILKCNSYYGAHNDNEFNRIQRILMFCSLRNSIQYV